MKVFTAGALIGEVQTVPCDSRNTVIAPNISQGRESSCIRINEFGALGYDIGHYRSGTLLRCKDGTSQERLVHVARHIDAYFLASHKAEALPADAPENIGE